MADPFSNASINSGVDISDVNGVFASRMQALIDAAESATGQTVTVNSGYRSPEKQAQIYANTYYRDPAHPFVYNGVTYKVTGPSSRVAAPPGNSQHQQGFAVDIRPSGAAYKWMTQNAAKYGVEWGGNWKGNQNDPPHFQLPRADNMAALSGKLPPVNVPEVASAFANAPPPVPKADPRSSALTAISNATAPQPTQMGAGENLAFDRSNALAGMATPALFPDGHLGTLNAQPPAMDAGYNPATGQVQPFANDPNILAAMGDGRTQQVVPPNLIQGSFDAIDAMKNRGIIPDGAVGSPPSLLNWIANQNRTPSASAAPAAAGASGVGSAQVSSPQALPTSPVYSSANDVANFSPTGPVPPATPAQPSTPLPSNYYAMFYGPNPVPASANPNGSNGDYYAPGASGFVSATPDAMTRVLDVMPTDVLGSSPVNPMTGQSPDSLFGTGAPSAPPVYSSVNDVASFSPTGAALPPIPRADPRAYSSLNDVAAFSPTSAPQNYASLNDMASFSPTGAALPPLPLSDPRGYAKPVAPSTPAAQTVSTPNGNTYTVGQILTTPNGTYKVGVGSNGQATFTKAVTLPTGGAVGGLIQQGLIDAGTKVAAAAPGMLASAGSSLDSLFSGLFGHTGGGNPVPPLDVPVTQHPVGQPYGGYIPGAGNSSVAAPVAPYGGGYNNMDAAASQSQGAPYSGYIPGSEAATSGNSWQQLLASLSKPTPTVSNTDPMKMATMGVPTSVQKVNPAYTAWLSGQSASPFTNPGVQGLSPDDRDSPDGIARTVPGLTSSVFAKPKPTPAPPKYITVAGPTRQVQVARPAPVAAPIIPVGTPVQQLQALGGYSPSEAYNIAASRALTPAPGSQGATMAAITGSNNSSGGGYAGAQGGLSSLMH